MKQVHLLCSTNWPPRTSSPDESRILSPFRTILSHLLSQELKLDRLILLGSNQPTDFQYASLVSGELKKESLEVEIKVFGNRDDAPSEIARVVSSSAEIAVSRQAELWVDLTPGPKPRSAALFAAASAVPDVKIVYAEQGENGYEVEPFQHLGSYNEWLGQHGVWIRNYREELSRLAEQAEAETKGTKESVRKIEILTAISSLLGQHPELESSALKPDSNLLLLAQWVANTAVPEKLFGATPSQWTGGANDYIKDQKTFSGRTRSAGRASQMLWRIRCIFAHEAPAREDAIALLDCLSFLAFRLNASSSHSVEPQATLEDRMFIAIDGDDVGRRFEERLAECVDVNDAIALHLWSQRVQRELSQLMVSLRDEWGGSFLARTGDGFLASFPASDFDDLMQNFRPCLTDATVTTGIGITVKDAYIGLKIGKARNRGGGIYFSFDPPEEKILWPQPNRSIK